MLTVFKDNMELEGGTSVLESKERMNEGEHNSTEIHDDLATTGCCKEEKKNLFSVDW